MRMMSGIRGRIGRVGECSGEYIGEAGRFQHTRDFHIRLILHFFVRLNECWWAMWCERIVCVLPRDGWPRTTNLHRKFSTNETPLLELLPAHSSFVAWPGLSGNRWKICEAGI